MPIYMDRHDIQGITAEEVAAVHQQDLKIQHRFECRALTYWFDEERGTAFCLIEAPERDAVVEMHREAHGQVPSRIIEVENQLVESFLGRIADPDHPPLSGHDKFHVFEEPAFRIVMISRIKNTAFIAGKLGLKTGLTLVKDHNRIAEQVVHEHGGRRATSADYGIIASFVSVQQAVNCAFKLRKKMELYNSRSALVPLHVAVSLAAGEPVTDSNTFFGETIKLADRLCVVAERTQISINVSPVVHEQYKIESAEPIPDHYNVRRLSAMEEAFLNHLMDVMGNYWDREAFNVAVLGRQMGISKSQLYRKITSLTGSTPGEFIREFRLNEAIKLIERQSDNIAQVAFATGFGNPSYFSKCFRQHVGILPSEYSKTMNEAS